MKCKTPTFNNYIPSMGQWLSWLYTGEEENQSKTYNVYLTGTWRNKNKSDVARLKQFMSDNISSHNTQFDIQIQVITQEDEGKRQAISALNILKKNGLLKPYVNKIITNYPEGGRGFLGFGSLWTPPPIENKVNLAIVLAAGRNSTQFTVVNLDWEQPVKVFKTSGFPKNGEPNRDNLINTAKECADWCGSNVRLIVGIDSIWHLLKNTSPVIKDNHELPSSLDKIKTKCNDFLDLGFLMNHYQYIPMISFRSVITQDGILRKTTFITGTQPGIDGGSGKWALVDPVTGLQLKYMDLPDEFTGDESKLKQIADECFGMVLDYENKMVELEMADV